MIENPIIVALDGMSMTDTIKMASLIKDTPGLWGVKVNDALRSSGYLIIQELRDLGVKVFADLKLHDIPNTVGNDIKKLIEFGPDLVTVHASGGVNMMAVAQGAAQNHIKILGVTVLTSHDEENCQLIYGCSVKAAVLKFGRMALTAGLDHLVCSAKDLPIFKRNSEFDEVIKFTPAIRPLWWQKLQKDFDDQKRVTTAVEAIEAGANYLVIGRPITQADDPIKAIKLTMKEIQGE